MPDWLAKITHSEGLEFKLIDSALIILMLVLIRGSIQKLAAKWEEDRRALYNWRKPTGYGSFLIGLVLLSLVRKI